VLASDADGDPVTVSLSDAPAWATISEVDGTPTLTVLPQAGDEGMYTFTIVAEDGRGGASTTEVTIAVHGPANRPPMAADVMVQTAEDEAVDVRLDVSDPDGDDLAVTILAAPANGLLAGDGLQRTYTPAPDWHGTDSFTYAVDDGEHVAQATVTVDVSPVNDAPVAAGVHRTTALRQAIDLRLLGIDVDGDELDYEIVESPSHGDLSAIAGDTVTYTPTGWFRGDDVFTYRVTDPDGKTASADVTVTVRYERPPCTITGTGRNDVLRGTPGDDVICGRGGHDVIVGGRGLDVLIGGDGRDELSGDDGDDVLDGGAGADRLFGGPGTDLLLGGAGRDVLFGQGGDDELDGGRGDDLLDGQPERRG
jgi:VCBS repeat-containing protein